MLPTIPLSTPLFFFFNDTATTEIYTLSLHDALPICRRQRKAHGPECERCRAVFGAGVQDYRSEEHTSELQSPDHLVCRLLLEKKKTPCNRPPAPAPRRFSSPTPASTSARRG